MTLLKGQSAERGRALTNRNIQIHRARQQTHFITNDTRYTDAALRKRALGTFCANVPVVRSTAFFFSVVSSHDARDGAAGAGAASGGDGDGAGAGAGRRGEG